MQFLVQSIYDLEAQLKKEFHAPLHKILVENVEREADVIERIHKHKQPVDTLFFNKDVTPYATKRDALLKRRCEALGIHVISDEDYLLLPLEHEGTKNKKGDAFRIFSFLYKKRKALHSSIPLPQKPDVPLLSAPLPLEKCDDRSFFRYNPRVAVAGGRTRALQILEAIKRGKHKNYELERNNVFDDDGTTRLSAYLKYGCISIREAYFAVYDTHGIDHGLIREFYFREFYYIFTFFHPRLLQGMKGANEKNQAFLSIHVPWRRDTKGFTLWQQGKTGTPLVDAGMRQLNETGFMHNRCRMVVAMYLTKDLLIDWREGERYFARRLVDYDPVQNSAGWQWSASVGTDAAPYFRIMNPYLQSRKFDPHAAYIKKWVPELKDVPARDIHAWEKQHTKYDHVAKPYVRNHTEAAKNAIRIYKK